MLWINKLKKKLKTSNGFKPMRATELWLHCKHCALKTMPPDFFVTLLSLLCYAFENILAFLSEKKIRRYLKSCIKFYGGPWTLRTPSVASKPIYDLRLKIFMK